MENPHPLGGPEDTDRLADEQAFGHEPPEPAVMGGAGVVPQHEQLVGGHIHDLSVAPKRPLVDVVARLEAAVALQRLAVDDHLPLADFHRIPAYTHQALDERPFRVGLKSKDYDVATARLAEVIRELRDEDPVALQPGHAHRAGRGFERRDHKRPDDGGQPDRPDERLQVLPPRQAARPHQIFNTARNASWGISTLPNCFIRFFPSCWRSQSLRLRVMSPP